MGEHMPGMERPSLYDENPDPAVWSNSGTWFDDEEVPRRYTWRELAEQLEDQLRKAREYQRILFDLDRCEHGRHEGDVCGGATGCNGPSKGNPLFRVNGHPPLAQHERRQLGFTIGGRPIVYPERAEGFDPERWEPHASGEVER